MKRNLYFFTNSFPYGIGEDWKSNELEILSKYCGKIHVIPYHYADKYSAKNISLENVITNLPLFNNNSILVTRAELGRIFFSKYFIFFFFEFVRNWVFLSKKKTILFLSDCVKILNLSGHPVITKIVKEHSPDSVFYFFWGRGSCLFIPMLRKEIKAEVIVRFHGYDLYEFRNHGYIPFRFELLKRIDKILTISKHGKEYLARKYPSIKSKIIVNPLGTIYKGKAKKSSDGILRIFSCSELIPLKRVSLLAKALKTLRINIEWTHIGDGPQRDELNYIVGNYPANIRFVLTGWVPSEKVSSFYVNQYCDLFINVSEMEGIPVSIMEAFSAGIPVYATKVGAVSEIVNEENGKLLNPDIQFPELARNIEEFNKLPAELKEQMSINAYNTYKEKYDARTNAEQLASICLKL